MKLIIDIPLTEEEIREEMKKAETDMIKKGLLPVVNEVKDNETDN